jgi:hypothetical protein
MNTGAIAGVLHLFLNGSKSHGRGLDLIIGLKCMSCRNNAPPGSLNARPGLGRHPPQASCEGKLKKFNENAFEAKGVGVIISLPIMPDGSLDVSYTGKNKANGICQVKEAK